MIWDLCEFNMPIGDDVEGEVMQVAHRYSATISIQNSTG